MDVGGSGSEDTIQKCDLYGERFVKGYWEPKRYTCKSCLKKKEHDEYVAEGAKEAVLKSPTGAQGNER